MKKSNFSPGVSAFAHNGGLDAIEKASATGLLPDNPAAATAAIAVDNDQVTGLDAL